MSILNRQPKLEPRMDKPSPVEGPEAYAPLNNRAAKYSEIAAQAAQNVVDLERELKMMQSELASAKSHIQVLEEANAILHEDIDSLRQTNERLNYVSATIQARITIATETLIGIQQVIPAQTQPPEPQVVKAIEKILADAEAKP